MDQDAYKAVIAARTQMIYHQRFFSCLAMNLKPAETSASPSTAFEGTHYFYNPEYILSLTSAQRIGSWAQAVTGCAYKHPMRRKWREQRRWSLACAYVINLDVAAAGFQLPPGSVVDAKFLGMTAEEVYAHLEEQDKQQQPKPGDEQSQGQGEVGGSAPGKGGDQEGDGEGEGQGDGTPTREQYDPGGAGEILDASAAHDANGNAEAADRWDQFARMAMAIAKAANAGTVPGELDRLYNELQQPRVDWREITRQWVDNSIHQDESWSRPNRRYLPHGIYFPGKVSDRLSHLLLIGDSSGSMGQRQWDEISTEVKAMLDEGVADKITVAYTDTKYQGHDVFEDSDEMKLNPKGGGGTHFADIMKWVAENASDATAMIFFTDLLTLSHGEDPGMPVLWAVHGNSRTFSTLASKVPFGDTLYIDFT